MAESEENADNEHIFGFPYTPYTIQEQLMRAIYKTLDERKVAILESPTGTGKSLSIICAALTWLQDAQRKEAKEIQAKIETLKNQIKEADADDDWMNAHGLKLEAQRQLAGMDEAAERRRRVDERVEAAKRNAKMKRHKYKELFGVGGGTAKRRPPSGGFDADENARVMDDGLEDDVKGDDVDRDILLTDDVVNPSAVGNNSRAPNVDDKGPRCLKIIYASRTHSQLEQFADELRKTRFRPRVITVGSRQLLCINETVRTLGNSLLINDRCNELLNAKGKGTTISEADKRLKCVDENDGKVTSKKNKKKSSCGCEFAKTDAIEELADEILARQYLHEQPSSTAAAAVAAPTFAWLTRTGRDAHACPYFASRSASLLCELVLVPYNVLLHRSTRDAWQLELRDNVVVVDEAHNLLQTLAAIHSCELDERRLDACARLLRTYVARFRTRLSPRNLLYIRQLHALTNALLTMLRQMTTPAADKMDVSASTIVKRSQSEETILTLPRFIAELNCGDIDIYRVLAFLDASNLCRKLRDFQLRYNDDDVSDANAVAHPSAMVDEQQQDNVVTTAKSRLNAFLQRAKDTARQKLKAEQLGKRRQVTWKNDTSEFMKREEDVSEAEPATRPPRGPSAPLYALREFLEALTTRAEDARVLVQRGASPLECSKFRFLLLNPAEKLRDVVDAVRSLILIGGTMRPVDQLLDAFRRVCRIDESRIHQFSCGHVVDDSQLTALSLGQGPTRTELNLSFTQRNSAIFTEIGRTLINLLRHVPNGVVAFFPSYAFLAEFVRVGQHSGDLAKIQNVKTIFVEQRGGCDGAGSVRQSPSFVASSKDNANCDTVWQRFCAAATASTRGALLLAVVGGKLSEGINFSDELGRCVIMIGLPYANKTSVELCTRMKYMNEHISADAGAAFYESLCLHAVNQAIGRAIRHRHDHAAIILLDARFLRPQIVDALPSWIRHRLTLCHGGFPEALRNVVAFFRDKQPMTTL